MPGNQVPFPFITDLPPRAQRELERNFFELQRQINPAASVFDCIIDGAATSNPLTHIYKNLTDAVAGETQYQTGVDLTVGVYQRATPRIVEPGPVNIAGKGNLSITSIANALPDALNLGWDFRGLNCTLGQQVSMNGVALDPQVTASVCDQGSLFMRDCYTGPNMTGLSGRTAFFWNCIFGTTFLMTSSAGVGISFTFFDCHSLGGFTTTSSLVGLQWFGGDITGPVTISNGCTIYGTINSTITITAGNFDIYSFGGGGSVVISGTGQGTVAGTGYAGVTMTNTGQKEFKGRSNFSGGNFDFTGPGYIQVQHEANNFGSHTILRGDGILADVHSGAAGGRLECVGLTNSQVRLSISNGTAASLSLDAASNHNIIILSGHNAAAFGGITDSGTLNRIITEDSDSYTTGAAAVSPTLLNGEIAAVQSGVQSFPPVSSAVSTDLWRKDFVLADLVGPISGVTTYPPAPPGAPSGAAGGSLAGTYPNPSFAGRDSSVDKINQDLLPALLVEGVGIKSYPAAPTTVAVDFNQVFMLMGG